MSHGGSPATRMSMCILFLAVLASGTRRKPMAGPVPSGSMMEAPSGSSWPGSATCPSAAAQKAARSYERTLTDGARALPVRTRLEFGHQKAVADVGLVEGEEVGVTVVPAAVGQVVGQPGQAGGDRFFTSLGEHGDAGPDDRIEVGLGASPVGDGEAVGAVMRNGDGLDPGGAEK